MQRKSTRLIVCLGLTVVLFAVCGRESRADETDVSSVIECIFQPGCLAEDRNLDGSTTAADLVAAIIPATPTPTATSTSTAMRRFCLINPCTCLTAW